MVVEQAGIDRVRDVGFGFDGFGMMGHVERAGNVRTGAALQRIR